MGDDEARFNSLAEPHLVGEDAATLGDTAQREHDGVDLVRVRVDPPAALRRHLPPTFASAPEADQLFRVVTTMDRMHRHGKLRRSPFSATAGTVKLSTDRRIHESQPPAATPSPSSEPRCPRFTELSFLLKLLDLLLDIEGGEDRECLAVLAQTDYLFSCREAVLAAEPSL